MTIIDTSAPEVEQEICRKCGFCCNGTLFLHACLNEGEKGNLPDMIESSVFSDGDSDYFKLPCNYFREKCTIYNEIRADVCSAYRCQLLKDLADNKITKIVALKVINEASLLCDEILNEFRNLTAKNEVICFKELPEIILKIINTCNNKKLKEEFELLLGKCNILEALLIKHIRSAGDFKDLMADSKV